MRVSEIEPYLQPGDKIIFINEFSTAKMSLPSARCLACKLLNCYLIFSSE